MNRLISDASSSTSGQLRKYMQNTELSDSIVAPRSETVASSVHSTQDEEHSRYQKARGGPAARKNARIIEEEEEEDDEDASFNLTADEVSEQQSHQTEEDGFPQPSEHAFAYQKKLKYLPNSDYKPDATQKSFNISSYSQPTSIPNTFKYKSHPNAKTKSKLGYRNEVHEEVHEEESESKEDSIDAEESPEANDYLDGQEPNERQEKDHHESQIHNLEAAIANLNISEGDHSIPPITSTINEKNKLDITPDWMPAGLDVKWIPPPGISDTGSLNTSKSNINKNIHLNPQLHHLEFDSGDFGSSVRITKSNEVRGQGKNNQGKSKEFNLQFPSTGASTMIHNSGVDFNHTPEWVKATKEYEEKKGRNPLQNFFMEHDDSNQNNSGNGGHTISSTASTPIPSLTNREVEQLQHLTQEQIQELIEKANPKNPSNPGSPLKLFGDKYNTYTKERLSDFLQKVQNKSPAIIPDTKSNDALDGVSQYENNSDEGDHDESNMVREEPNNASKKLFIANYPEPKMKIKNFTKSGSYTEKEFLNNAENIFKDIKERGFKRNIRDVTNLSNVGSLHNQELNNTKSRLAPSATTTSTPKNDKVSNISEYSSFTSGFEEFEESKRETANNSSTNNEFTSFERSGDDVSNRYAQLSPRNLKNLQKQLSAEADSSYTYDDESEVGELIQESIVANKESDQGINSINKRLDEIESMLKSNHDEELLRMREENELLKSELIKQKQQMNAFISPLRDVTMDSLDDITQSEVSQVQEFIKWKRTSQLKLEKTPEKVNTTPQNMSLPSSFVRGRVNPNVNLPVEYNNMYFDGENQKWINNDTKEEIRGSLDSIEDLVSDSDMRNEQVVEEGPEAKSPVASISRSKNNRRNGNGSKLEVSFHLPNSTLESEDDFKMRNSSAVTNVSQLQDSTFSQTRKRLVNIITDVLGPENLDWDRIFEISLSGYELENLKDLEKFLPKLKSLNISNNQLKFLEGISSKILELDISQNEIDNLSSFKKFHDLQVLKASFNSLKSLQTLNGNIHLTELNVSSNKLTSLKGLENLSNLITLDVSKNELNGEIELSHFRSLQSINLSENRIKAVRGIEKVTKLRVLNLNENPKLENIECNGKHLFLKKLSLKFNNLEELNLECYPYLRILRIDGNQLKTLNSQLQKLKHLEEISCKSQIASSSVLDEVFLHAQDLKRLDISGNPATCLQQASKNLQFLNLNTLVLSAMNLTSLPENFAKMFPNIRELNLNFNKLESILPLLKLTNLRKLYVLSNNIQRTQSIVSGISSSKIRKTLQVLDLRLNQVNIEFYPFVFNQQELEYSQHLKTTANIDISPIQLETLDDIESFAILYESLNKSYGEWVERDSKFLDKLRSTPNSINKVHQRINYEMLLVNVFVNLRKLDGSLISSEKREILSNRFNAMK